MSSILNSISQGDLQVQSEPRDKPNKKDSIIELLQSSEIEFKPCPPEEIKEEVYIEFKELPKEEPSNENSIPDLIINSEIELGPCVPPDIPIIDFNTGFGANQDIHYETPCSEPKLKIPLYQENFLREFVTEEEKAAARHSLGLYNKGDVVAMSLLTAEPTLPNKSDWENSSVKQLRQGDTFFTPVTAFKAVYDTSGTTLDVIINQINLLVTEQQKKISKIIEPSNQDTITSLGDVTLFLKGFNNGEILHNTIDDMNREMLRFEKTGQIMN